MSSSQYHVFSLPKELLDTLIPRNDFDQAQASPPEARSESPVPAAASGASSRACNVCLGAMFADVDEQRAHYRSDWHRYNVKVRLNGGAPVSESQFAQLVDGESTSLDVIISIRSLTDNQDWRTPSQVLHPRRKGTLKTRMRSRRSYTKRASSRGLPLQTLQ